MAKAAAVSTSAISEVPSENGTSIQEMQGVPSADAANKNGAPFIGLDQKTVYTIFLQLKDHGSQLLKLRLGVVVACLKSRVLGQTVTLCGRARQFIRRTGSQPLASSQGRVWAEFITGGQNCGGTETIRCLA